MWIINFLLYSNKIIPILTLCSVVKLLECGVSHCYIATNSYTQYSIYPLNLFVPFCTVTIWNQNQHTLISKLIYTVCLKCLNTTIRVIFVLCHISSVCLHCIGGYLPIQLCSVRLEKNIFSSESQTDWSLIFECYINSSSFLVLKHSFCGVLRIIVGSLFGTGFARVALYLAPSILPLMLTTFPISADFLRSITS